MIGRQRCQPSQPSAWPSIAAATKIRRPGIHHRTAEQAEIFYFKLCLVCVAAVSFLLSLRKFAQAAKTLDRRYYEVIELT